MPMMKRMRLMMGTRCCRPNMKRNRSFLINYVAAGSLMAVASTAIAPFLRAAAPPLRAAVEAHLTAVSARNMEALLPTLTKGNELTMIAPNGHRSETKQEYVDFHRVWFATKDD